MILYTLRGCVNKMKKEMKNEEVKNKEYERFEVREEIGLTDEQVKKRIHNGEVNIESKLKTKSIPRIFRDNFFTLFNLINVILAVAILSVGSYRNVLFMGVIICNIAIGTFQEIRAKKAVEKLSFIASTKIKAIRNKVENLIHIEDIVLDDILELSNGNQIPVDCIVMSGECDVNESLLTGESDSIHKVVGDTLYSGSYIVSGKCRVKADKVGKDTYVSSVFSGARYVKKVNSEIMKTLNKIIKIVSIAIFPIGALFFMGQMHALEGDISQAIINSGAALIGMIPEGLILLTSTVLAVSIIRLSKHKVLVQELYCIETLARVDVLCLDKTGTITQGTMELKDVVLFDGVSAKESDMYLNSIITNLNDENDTFKAIKERYNKKTDLECCHIVPFSSDKKWSGASFTNYGTFVIGAAEFIFKEVPKEVQESLQKYSDDYRVLVLAISNQIIEKNDLPEKLQAVSILLIKDKIRKNAKETLAFFEAQGVDLKIISGDNVKTVAGIAKEVGFKNYDKYIDATTIKTTEELKEAAKKYSIFGRVTPVQKKELVIALKEEGHTVAMTGDGVNDVLALKEADCSVAMASGSEAARNVSQLVLLNSDFSSMPQVVAEGRRSINNIQRSASLFLVKTIYSAILSLLFVFIPYSYPFEPIQMTLLNAFTIGLPSFILALQPNKNRIEGKFFINVISKAIPTAVVVITSILSIVFAGNSLGFTSQQISTVCGVVTGLIGIMFIIKLCIPFNLLRSALVVVCISGLVLGITVFGGFFDFVIYNNNVLMMSGIVGGVAVALFITLNCIVDRINKKRELIQKR